MSGAPALSTALRRRQHFTEFWAQKGVHDIAFLSAEKYSAEAGAESVRAYLSQTAPDARVDVLMCENDILALGAMDEVRGRFGLRVPEDIAIVGFDNFELGGSSAYSLTTYEQPRHEMVQTIVGMIMGSVEAQTVTLPGKLVVRNSA
jgi:LacI family transcriptional regulator